MPTGYTQALYNGDQTFREFVQSCAHAFIIDMRDSAIGSEIPDKASEPTHSYEYLADAKIKLDFYQNMSDEDAEQGAKDRFIEDYEAFEKAEQKRIAMRGRYVAMLNKVKAWEITPDLQGLKDFMVQQLESSIQFDTDYVGPTPKRKTGPEYKQAQIESAQRSVDYAQFDVEKAVARRDSNQRWIDNFWSALDKA